MSIARLAGLLAIAALAAPVAQAATPAAPAPDHLVLYFDPGSAAIRADGMPVLDTASRLYREGSPIVMVVSGATDLTGAPAANLALSQRRAQAVLEGLVSRGIPAERFQVLAKGETEPAVITDKGVAEARNRRVEITWR